MSTNIGELFIKLGVKAANLQIIPNLKKGLQDIIKPAMAARIELMGFAATVTVLTERASKAAAELNKFRNLTGLSTQTLQAWQQQAAMSGVSADEMTSSIEGLQQAQYDLSMGNGNLAPWAMLGIDPQSNPFDVLEQLKTKLGQFDTVRGTALARDLRLSDSMISFLREAKSLPAADKSLIMSDKEIKQLKAFNIYFNQFWSKTKLTLQRVGIALAPVAKGVLDAMLHITNSFQYASKGIEWLVSKFKAVGPVLAAIGFIIVAAFSPVTAVLIGFALAFDDIMTWMRGGKSVTGALIGPFKEWRDTLKQILDLLNQIKDFAFGELKAHVEEIEGAKIAIREAATKAGLIGEEDLDDSGGFSLKKWFRNGAQSMADLAGEGRPAVGAGAGVVGALAGISQSNIVNINLIGSMNSEENVKAIEGHFNNATGISQAHNQMPTPESPK